MSKIIEFTTSYNETIAHYKKDVFKISMDDYGNVKIYIINPDKSIHVWVVSDSCSYSSLVESMES